MGKYWAYFRVGLQNTLAFRGPMVVWLLSNSIGLVAILAVWLSVSDVGIIATYSKGELITYYTVSLLLSWTIGWYPFWIANNIKDGTIVGEILLKPVSLFWRAFMADLAWHTISVLMAFAVYVVIWSMLRNYFIFSFNLIDIFLIITSSLLAIFVIFTAAVSISLSAFWLTESNFSVNVFWAFMMVFGGHILPITFLPGVFNFLANISPFRYMFSFPMEIILKKISYEDILGGHFVGLVWLGILVFLYKFLWRRGIKVYSSWG